MPNNSLKPNVQAAPKPEDFMVDGNKRYPGHNTAGNKRAIIHVIKDRDSRPNVEVSYPEKRALTNSLAKKEPVTGQGNKDKVMINGTAICHKLSANEIQTEINNLGDQTLKGSWTALNGRLEKLIKYIKPDHTAHMTPPKGDYNTEAIKKYKDANIAFNFYKNENNAKKKMALAHGVGKNVANSPVNLFIGDSKTNSTIKEDFDANQITIGKKRSRSPRSIEGAKLSTKGPQHPMSSAM